MPSALVGSVFGLFDLVDPLVSGPTLAFWGLVFGAHLGAAFGLASRASAGERSDFTSVGAMRAHRYAVVADGKLAGGAVRRLSGGR